MKSFYFTFGAGQYASLLDCHYVEIVAPNEIAARVVMVDAFGQKWSMCYDELPKDWPGPRPLQRLGKLDEFGNVLER